MDAILPLRGVIKQYDWGGRQFIADLLSLNNHEQKPFAEYWMGIHPQGMAQVQTSEGAWLPLDQLAGELSFLLKVLDVSSMLSIQVHPTKAAALYEFERENRLGIPLEAPHRNYKDANHKPELMVALSDFWLLHGFQERAALTATLRGTDALAFLLPFFEQGGYEGLYRRVMEMPQEEVDQRLRSHIDSIVPLYQQNVLARNNPDFWAARAALSFSQGGSIDRGIFSIYLFNLVQLRPGEAIFQDAGVPHAYLEGQNVEIMANSDNVLRGGLTNKHIDVGELMKHVQFEPIIPHILLSSKGAGWFETPVDDFKLGQLSLSAGSTHQVQTATPLLLLCMRGSVEVEAGGRTITLKQGQPAALLRPEQAASIKALSDVLLFSATQGIHTR
ncbi:MAG: mannose-6-phosphate isomerase, class I [Chitinophagia bacterium]|nr:mannose-6-phosphate isomerase, class I [Chitinophagia bacterium]